jgi:ribosomal protein S18 acetylase RimI-like enzyme
MAQGSDESGRVTAGATLRPARLAEAELVREISAEAYLPAYEPIIGAAPRPAFEDYRPRIERGEVWLLEMPDGLAGLAVLEQKPDHLLVYSIAVKPGQQRKGYGRMLLRFAEGHAAALGLRELRLYTNQRMTENLRLYRACGFAESGRRPHPSRPGEILVDLMKRLPEN